MTALLLLSIFIIGLQNGRKNLRHHRKIYKNLKNSKERQPDNYVNSTKVHLGALRELVKDQKLIGYITDEKQSRKLQESGYITLSEKACAYYYGVQYIVAPVIVAVGRRAPKLVGHFDKLSLATLKEIEAQGYEVERRFTGGFILFRERP
jgi:hypothetical protein